MPHTIQEWHFHKKIDENILIDRVHTFENDTDEVVEFVVFRFVPNGIDKREVIKTDKIVVER